jgi:hypothetical protein
MSAAKVNTAIKMLESLPEEAQDRVLEHLREYIEDLRDEAKWDHTFARTQKNLVKAAKKARREIAAGKAKPMDLKQL